MSFDSQIVLAGCFIYMYIFFSCYLSKAQQSRSTTLDWCYACPANPPWGLLLKDDTTSPAAGGGSAWRLAVIRDV